MAVMGQRMRRRLSCISSVLQLTCAAEGTHCCMAKHRGVMQQELYRYAGQLREHLFNAYTLCCPTHMELHTSISQILGHHSMQFRHAAGPMLSENKEVPLYFNLKNI